MPHSAKEFLRSWCPPVLWDSLRAARTHAKSPTATGAVGDQQDLNVYWDENLAQVLETWGEKNAWNEIQLLMENCSGKVLDIACGTGKVMELLAGRPRIEVHGFDISDFLLQKAAARGIASDRLKVSDATKTAYSDGAFQYSYSIGSLEHFTLDGVTAFLSEASRITEIASFHMIPISRSGLDEGWIKTIQTYHNNSLGWWLPRFEAAFSIVEVVGSAWEDEISTGLWFLCRKDIPAV